MIDVEIPGMLLIGSAGRNSGKTELACRLLSHFGSRNEITAIKVTTIHDSTDGCPRGGEGCGVCESMDQPYVLTEETDLTSPKDTSRLLANGASRVLWLKVHEAELSKGVEALKPLINMGQPSICESNSLRLEVVPDLFLIVRHSRSQLSIKPSAARVASFADRWVISDGAVFDMNPDELMLRNGRWEWR